MLEYGLFSYIGLYDKPLKSCYIEAESNTIKLLSIIRLNYASDVLFVERYKKESVHITIAGK